MGEGRERKLGNTMGVWELAEMAKGIFKNRIL